MKKRNIDKSAFDVLGDKELVERWLTTPKTVLGGKIPRNLLETKEGLQEVKNLLGQIEHSVYS